MATRQSSEHWARGRRQQSKKSRPFNEPVDVINRQNLQGVLVAASFFLPRRMRKRLTKMAV